jgi:hypothetical protein
LTFSGRKKGFFGQKAPEAREKTARTASNGFWRFRRVKTAAAAHTEIDGFSAKRRSRDRRSEKIRTQEKTPRFGAKTARRNRARGI